VADTIAIRTAGAEDIAKIVALLNVAFAMERDFVDRDRTSDAEISGLMRTGTFLVAGGEADALAACATSSSTARAPTWACWRSIPSLQGRGLGRRMIAAVENRAIDAGCTGIDIKIVDRSC
jgi:predicted N-acetyltransferase YhbS